MSMEKQGVVADGVTPVLGPGPLEEDTVKRASDGCRRTICGCRPNPIGPNRPAAPAPAPKADATAN